MRRHYRMAAVIAAAMLFLTACGGGGQTQNPGNNADVMQKEENGEASEGVSASETPSETASESAAEPAGQTQQPYSFPLVEGENYSAELLQVLNADDGGRMFLARTRNNTEEDLIITLDRLRLNGTIIAIDSLGLYPDAGEERITELQELQKAFLTVERDGIRVESISCDVRVESFEQDENGNNKVLYEAPVEITIPKDFEPRVVYEPTLSMRAEEQVLREDENVRITLTNLGKIVDDSTYEALSGVVRVDNLSGAEIPVYVQGIKINGYYFEVYGSSRGDIPAGHSVYIGFYCSSSDLEEAEITEIEAIDLQIMTSEEENTGTVYGSSGGKWYSVILAEHGTGTVDTGAGIPVYEDDYIRVELTGAEAVWNEYTFTDPSGHYEWRFTFINKTDKGLDITFEDFMVNGEPDTGETGSSYVMVTELGADARTNDRVWHSTEEQTPLPELAFRVMVKSAGGGTLYNYSEEYVTITQDMVQQVTPAQGTEGTEAQ